MEELISNPVDISKSNREKLVEAWNSLDQKNKTPGDYFSSLPDILLKDFYEKLEAHCKQILKNKGYNQWAYNKYRIDHNGDEGATILFLDVNTHLLMKSKNNSFVNLKEIFKNGEENINRNLNQIIKRVLINNREKTVIDRLLRRIEEIADDDNNNIVRNRIEKHGPKADYFTTLNLKKIPEERDPTNHEIEDAISLVGNFKESPPKEGAKQASRIYTTTQLIEIMEIICSSLPTDVTPNTLETIFIDLIPDFLPDEFLIEKVFKIYGHVQFPLDINHKLSIQDLDQSDQIIVQEMVKECLETVIEEKIQTKCKTIKNHLYKKSLNINTLAREEVFASREDVENTLNTIGNISNKLFATIENELVAEVAFNIFFDEI